MSPIKPTLNTAPNDNSDTIRVGLCENHGKVIEDSAFPPAGVSYHFLEPSPSRFPFIRSPIKGYLRDFNTSDIDVVESMSSPVLTDKPWILSLTNLQEPAAFNFMGAPIPRRMRIAWLQYLFRQPNFAGLTFWSEAGRQTLQDYGGVSDPRVLEKSLVVYPSIRRVDDALIRFDSAAPTLLFSGDFFRKGGAHVIDAFERLLLDTPNAVLWLCCDEALEFNTGDADLRARYIQRIRSNPQIRFGRVSREKMLGEILPQTDVYLLPTYAETFGFALLEAMAFGVPVISTQHFAIPEIVEHERSGYLIGFDGHDPESFCQGYVVSHIPEQFHAHMSEQVYQRLKQLLGSQPLRQQMGAQAVEIARSRFSIEQRNRIMGQVYADAVGNRSAESDPVAARQ